MVLLVALSNNIYFLFERLIRAFIFVTSGFGSKALTSVCLILCRLYLTLKLKQNAGGKLRVFLV